MKVAVLYGTETGNTEMLAEDLMAEIKDGNDVTCRNLSDFTPDEFDRDTFFLVICSTYGDGELPASAKPFAERIHAAAPDLAGVHFAILGLGDRKYEETFGFGSKRIAELLAQHGATQIGERVVHDASGSDLAEDLAFPWAAGILALAKEKLSAAAR